MNPEVLALLGRIAERTAAWGLAGLLLYFAFQLSKMLTTQPSQSAQLKWKDFVVKLTRVTPGVFFAVLATAIVVVNLRSPLEISTGSNKPSAQNSPRNAAGQLHIQYGAGQLPFSPVEMSVTINRLGMFARILTETPENAETIRELRAAAESLMRDREDLLAMTFGKTTLDHFRHVSNNFAADRSSVPEADRDRYEALQRALFSTEPAK